MREKDKKSSQKGSSKKIGKSVADGLILGLKASRDIALNNLSQKQK